MKKFLIILLVLFVLLAAAVGAGAVMVQRAGGMEKFSAQFKPKEKVTTVQLTGANRGDMTITVNAPGTVEPDVLVDVSAKVSAKIIGLPFREGDDVRAGDVIVRLDAEDLSARLDAAKARLRAENARLDGARASLRLSEIELGRQRGLRDSGDVSQSALDESEARYAQDLANVAAIEASIESVKADITERERDLAEAVISAPISGTITRLNNEVGELVLGTFNNVGSTIMQIADLQSMLVRARIDESNIAQVRSGQKARVTLNAYPDRVFEGEVRRVKLQREVYRDGTNYVEAEVRLNLNPDDRLQTGLTANVDIEVKTIRDVLMVPMQAVLDRRVDQMPLELRTNNPLIDTKKTFARVVYVYEGGEAVAKPVSVGLSDLSNTIIVAGLAEEARVISGPYKSLGSLAHKQKVIDEVEAAKKAEEEKAKQNTERDGTAEASSGGGGGGA